MQSALSGQDKARCLTNPFSLCTVYSPRTVLGIIPVYTANSNLAATRTLNPAASDIKTALAQ